MQRTSSCDVVVPVAFFASRSGPPLSLDSHHDRGAPSDYIYSQADYTSCHWPACAVAMQGHTTPRGPGQALQKVLETPGQARNP